MKIVTLIENLVYQRELVAEHGLSVYVEDENVKVLFDTGQGGIFMHNAAKLGIRIEDIDALVISHGHYDHTGGLYPFLEQNRKAVVYAKKAVFDLKYNRERRFAGTPFHEEILKGRLHLTDKVTPLSDNIFIMPEIPVNHPEQTHFQEYFTLSEGELKPDCFEDEQFLVLLNNGMASIVTACSHRGIANIVEHTRQHFGLPIHTILGGFHTEKVPADQMEPVVDFFRTVNPQSIGVSHCTGIDKYALLRMHLGERVFYNNTGKEILL